MKIKLKIFVILIILLAISLPIKSNAENKVIDANQIQQFKKTKKEIQDLWKTSNLDIAKGDYNIYDEEPSYVAPYKGGVVKQEYLDKVIKNLNYYRYLVGSPEITEKITNREDLQAGVVLQYLYYKSTYNLSHWLYKDFKKPDDMTEEFYNLGAYADHNIISAYNYRAPVFPFFSESIFDITAGHRTALLFPSVNKVEFGLGKTVYGHSHNSGENYNKMGAIAAYPSPGYFPKQDFADESDWDIYLNPNNFQSLNQSEKNNVVVKIKSVEKNETYTYKVSENNLVVSGTAIFIKQPQREDYAYYDGDYEVYVSNLKDKEGNLVDLIYTVKFFDKFEGIESNIKSIEYENRLNEISFGGDYSEDVAREYLPKNVTLILETGSRVKINIKDFTVKKATSNMYYDKYEYTPITDKLPNWVKDENNQFKPFSVYCYKHKNYDSYNYSKTELKRIGKNGDKMELEFHLYSTVPGYNFSWIREKDGKIEKLENGSKYTINETKLTINKFDENDVGNYYLVNDYRSPSLYNTSITFSKKISVTTGLLGDIDKDGEITSFDAYTTLEKSISGDVTQDDINAIDIDKDGEITSYDAYLILSYSVGIIDSKYWN